jgi:hypothetical protein
MNTYFSEELLECIKKDNFLNLSIHHHHSLSVPFLRPNHHAVHNYNKNIFFELNNFVYLEPCKFTIDDLQKILHSTVIVQYPSDTYWSTEYTLRFMKLTKVTDSDVYFENYITDTVILNDGTTKLFCDTFHEKICNFRCGDDTLPAYKIWLPVNMCNDLFLTNTKK